MSPLTKRCAFNVVAPASSSTPSISTGNTPAPTHIIIILGLFLEPPASTLRPLFSGSVSVFLVIAHCHLRRLRARGELPDCEAAVLNGPPAFSLLRGATTSTGNTQFYPTDNTDPEIQRRSRRRPHREVNIPQYAGAPPAEGMQTAITTPPSVPGWTYPNHEGLSAE